MLVTPVLDAALGPLLASAAGAVAEIGGLLSHGAVVARELGVPCVVDIRDATRRLRTGQRVLVDGSAGEVRPLPEPADGAERPVPIETLPAASPADEAFHPLEAHPLARESVYVNAQDPAAGIVLVVVGGRAAGGRGRSAAGHRPARRPRPLRARARSRCEPRPRAWPWARVEAGWAPVRLRFDGRLSVHEAAGFPPGPVPLVLAPRTAVVRFDLRFDAHHARHRLHARACPRRSASG